MEYRSWRLLERLLLASRDANGTSILTFHRVLPKFDPYRPGEPTVEEFEELVQFLSDNFVVSRLDESILEERSSVGGQRVVISFDDGYADNYEIAYPVLKKYGTPAVFFVASGMLDTGNMWNDVVLDSIRLANTESLDLRKFDLGMVDIGGPTEKLRAIVNVLRSVKYLECSQRNHIANSIRMLAGVGELVSPMMSTTQLKRLSEDELCQIGGHTVTHPILSNLSSTQAGDEIEGGKKQLERIIEKPITCFAYPNGIPGTDYARKHVGLVSEAGFTLAVTTSPGGVGINSDPLQLSRFTPWDKQHWRFGLRMLLTARSTGNCI